MTVPKILAAKIRKKHVVSEEGWGRLAAVAKIGGSVWKTAIWYDSKASSYLLPIKAQVRKAESAEVGDNLKIVITIEAADRRLVSLLSL